MPETYSLSHDWFPRPLPEGVKIGPRSWLYSSFAFQHCQSRRPVPVRIGSDSGIYLGTHFELGPQGEVQVGSFCTIVSAIIRTDQRVVIEDYSFIAHEVVLADRVISRPPRLRSFESNHRLVEAQCETPSLSIAVRRNAWIGARAVLLHGADIGEGAIVGAAAIVDFAVPAFAIVAGNPAVIVGWARPRP
jgi:UDP-2-acetamido-3-amino-2,3-dideoxy-glucuronate N-acetyltransferase